MASPQVENGYTKIANELLEKLCLPGINGSEYRIILFVVRKTYGFNKKQDRISFTQFQKGTGMNRAHAIRTINSLVDKRILVKDGSVYRFNKNWEEWVVHKRVPSTQKDTTASTQKDTKTSTQTGTYKRKKETITKDNPQSGEEVNEIISLFKEVNPSIGKYYGRKHERQAVERMLKEHGRATVEDMIKVLPQVNAKPYWPKSITPVQLEDNIGKYKALNESDKNKHIKNATPLI